MRKNNSNSVNTDLLKTFFVVADCGNVSRAAIVLGRTQSAISLQIRKLEERLATTLFARSSRGVALTAEGKKLLPAARKAIAAIDNVERLFTDPLSGRIRVGIPDDYNETILERALAQFSRQYSSVEVFVRSGCTREFPEAIARDKLDLALYSAGEVKTTDIFCSEATVWAASTNFVLAEDEPVPLAQFDRDCWWRDVAADALDAIGRPWRTAYSSENYSSVKAAIGAGLAVGPLAASALGESMRVLDRSDGFPQLPSSTLRLLKNARASSAIVQAMETAIRAAIR